MSEFINGKEVSNRSCSLASRELGTTKEHWLFGFNVSNRSCSLASREEFTGPTRITAAGMVFPIDRVP